MINIGPLTLARRGSVQLKAAPAVTGEKGAPTGVSRFGRRGSLLNLAEVDYLEAMQPPTRWATIGRMMSDDAVRAAFRALTLPILSTPLTVEPGTNDQAGREMADLLQADLDSMTGGLQKHRREALGFLADGVRVFEKVFEVRGDGLLHLRKLALRPNSSIIEWQVDERGGPVGVIQMDTSSREVELEIARLLIFTHDGEGANLVGNSIFRSAYKPWWYKDKLERIAYIAAERGAVGVPVGTQTGDDDDVGAAIEDILMGVRAHDSGFVREVEGKFKFRIEGLTGDRVDSLPILQDFRRNVFVSVLADFLALGDGTAGSWALSQDKSSFFVMALRSVVKDLEDTYGRYLVADWVRANWGDVPAASLPKVTHGALNTRNVAEWFDALTAAVEKGVFFPDPQMQAMAREILEIPDAPEAAKPQSAEDAAAQQPNAAGEQPAALPGVNVQQAAARTKQANSERGRQHLGEKCSVCGSTDGLTIHHTEPGTDNNAPGNLQTVCKSCHDEWSGYTQKGGGNQRITQAKLDAYRKESGQVAAALEPPRLESLVKIEALGIKVRFAEIEGALDRGEGRMVERLTKLQEKQAKRLAARASKIIKAEAWDQLAEERIPSDEEAAVIEEELLDLYRVGGDEYGRELLSQGVKPITLEDKAQEHSSQALLAAFALFAGARLADRMLNAWGAEVMTQARSGYDAKALVEAVGGMAGSLLADLARQGASIAFGQGRTDAGAKNAGLIKWEIYSTMLDGSVCKRCAPYEGRGLAIGEPPTVPNPSCLGLNRCRCLRIPVADQTEGHIERSEAWRQEWERQNA